MSFLAPPELVTLTGLKQSAAQIRFLQRRGIRHIVDARGKPVVTWDAVNGTEREKKRPNFAAIRRVG